MTEQVRVQLDYEGLRWDGSLEGAEAICEAIRWCEPTYSIHRSFYVTREGERELTVSTAGFGSNSKSYRLNAGDLLGCIRTKEAGLRPERVVKSDEIA